MRTKTRLQQMHDNFLDELTKRRKLICAELGISQATFYNIVMNSNGRFYKCSPVEKEVIAKHYGVTVAELWPAKVKKSSVK